MKVFAAPSRIFRKRWAPFCFILLWSQLRLLLGFQSYRRSLPDGISWRSSAHIKCQQSAIPSSDSDPPQQYVVHTGRSAAMIKRAPALSGITLCKGWTPSATEVFRRAILTCVKKNPILSGHVYEKGKKELWIQSGTFSPETHEFCKLIPPPQLNTDLSTLVDTSNANEILDQLTTRYLDMFDASELTSEQIQKKLPLFGASLMVQDDVAIFSLKVSHAVGDGVTFFEVLKQVSLLMSNDGNDAPSIPTIEWNHPLKPTHEFYPPNFSACDIEISYGAPFILGCAKNVLTQYGKRVPSVFLVDKNKISSLKRAIREDSKKEASSSSTLVSSNDIITAGLCQANVGAEVFIFTENVRAVIDSVPRNAGGNFLWEIPVRREVCLQPERLRQVIQQLQTRQEVEEGQGDHEQLPWRPFLCGKVARVTSLASITESIVYDNVKTICTLPALSFMKDIPLDVAVIFRYNKAYWGVLHNTCEFEIEGTILQDAIQLSRTKQF